MAAETTLSNLPESVTAETLTALPPELYPNIDHIVTEDDTPVDSIFSEKQQRLLTEPLYSSWSGPDAHQRFVALANVGMFFAIRKPPYVPDMLLSLDVELPSELWPKRNRSYFVWEYGKPPEVVIEIVSNREGGEDSVKLSGYAKVGVKYYVIFDPEKWLSDQLVRVFQLDAMNYREMSEPFWFSGVELGLRLWTGSYEGRHETWLRWVDGDGQLIPTGAERAEYERARAQQEHERAEGENNRAEQEKQTAELAKQRAEQEKQRAEQEKQRAEQEKQRAEQEKQRAERLAEQLRRLGHEPDA